MSVDPHERDPEHGLESPSATDEAIGAEDSAADSDPVAASTDKALSIETESVNAGGHAVVGTDVSIINNHHVTHVHERTDHVVPQPARNLLQHIWETPITRWLLVASIPTLLLIGLYQLGLESHRARLALIGLPGFDLAYSAGANVGQGAHVIARLVWYMFAGLFTGEGIESWAAFVVVAIAGVPVVLAWRRRARLALAFGVLALPMLAYATVLFSHAVGIHHVAMAEGLVHDWPCNPASLVTDSRPSMHEQIRHEVCSWVRNDSDGHDKNDGRRIALGGLFGWLTLAWFGLIVAFWSSLARYLASRQTRGRPSGLLGGACKWAGRALLLLQGSLLLFLLLQTARTFAIAHHGLRYPKVTSVAASCNAELHNALGKRQEGFFECNVVRLAPGAVQELILLNGPDCPGQAEDETPRPQAKFIPARATDLTPCIGPTERSALITDQD